MKEVKIALIGLGSMGFKYAQLLLTNQLGFKIVALTRIKEERLNILKEYFKDEILIYDSDMDLFSAYDRGEVKFEAVLITTPHYSHIKEIKEALRRNLFVLSDKPLGVRLSEALELKDYNTNKLALIFQQREYASHKELVKMIKEKIYGSIKRFNYVITDWYRPNSYYKNTIWRASYKTDGGGLVINQCPHNLDFITTLFGMPNKVWAKTYCAKYHPIEVEDEVSCFFSYSNNMSGTFISSTGELPSINRLDISFSKALVSLKKDELDVIENEFDESYYRTLKDKVTPNLKKYRLAFNDNNREAYLAVLSNYYDVIINNAKPLVTYEEALNNLALINAIYLSSFINQEVSLDDFAKIAINYDKELNKRF